jgi:hypothetical protein
VYRYNAGAHAANIGASKETKARTDWRASREKPVGPSGLKSVFNAFCTFGGGSAVGLHSLPGVRSVTWAIMAVINCYFDCKMTW